MRVMRGSLRIAVALLLIAIAANPALSQGTGIVTGTAAGSEPRVRVVAITGGAATEVNSILAFDAAFTEGVFVG